jgi:hypothetical protein
MKMSAEKPLTLKYFQQRKHKHMSEKNDTKEQLKVINTRLEVLINRWNKQYDQNIQELLQLSSLLQNLEDGNTEINKALSRVKPSWSTH